MHDSLQQGLYCVNERESGANKAQTVLCHVKKDFLHSLELLIMLALDGCERRDDIENPLKGISAYLLVVVEVGIGLHGPLQEVSGDCEMLLA